MVDQLGVDLELVAVPRIKTASGYLQYELSENDRYPQHLLPSLFRSHNILRVYDPFSLSRLVRRFDPAIVHIEVEPHALALTQIILLRSVYDFQILFFTWENIYRKLPLGLRWIERFNLKRVDAALSGTSEAKSVLRRRGFQGTIDVVPQVGLDPRFCANVSPHPDWAALRNIGPVVGFVGRLMSIKGVEDLLEAFGSLSRTFELSISQRPQLFLVGAGPLEHRLRALAERHRITDQVSFSGQIPFRDVPNYLKCMDMLVLPSRTGAKWKEQFGHVLIEAMACGVPVIGSDSGAIPSVIGESGLTYTEGDIGALAAALQLLMTDDALRERFVERGLDRAATLYSDELIANETLRVYRRMSSP